MLTEQTKNFIENIASNMQGFVKMDEPNKYDLLDLVEFAKSMGCMFEFSSDKDYYFQNKIHLTFDQDDMEHNIDNNKLRVLFHEIWHFISEKIVKSDLLEAQSVEYSEVSVNPREASANYFSRAMLLPEKQFVEEVINNIDENGMCNIFGVAKTFDLSYMDVIARGNDLSLWNKKGGV